MKVKLVLRVKDLDASVSFYHETLGWTVGWREGHAIQMQSPAGHAAILTPDPAPDVRPWMDDSFSEPAPGQKIYLFGKDLPALKERLEAKGVSGVEAGEDPGFGRHLSFPDPDGYIVGLWEELHMDDAEIIALYREGPVKLEDALAGLTEADLDLARAPGKWSIRQITLHLIDSAMGWFHRKKFALAEPGRLYKTNGYNQDVWAAGLDYAHRPVEPDLVLYKAAVQHIVLLADHLPGALDRTIRTDRGEQSVRYLMKMIGGHTRGHIRQIQETRQVHGR